MKDEEYKMDLAAGRRRDVEPVDAAGLAHAKGELVDAAKVAGKAAKALADKATQLQLAAIESEVPFEESCLMSDEEIGKKYTAENGKQVQWRRDAAVYMLARQCPAQDIAKILHMNLRTIAALAARNGQQLAGFSEQYAKELLAQAGAAFALAATKAHEANYLQLVTGGGIMADKAMALKGGTQSGGEVVELEAAEDPLLAKAREFLKLKSAGAGSSTTDEHGFKKPEIL